LLCGALLATLLVPVYTREDPQRLNLDYELDATSAEATWALQPDAGRPPAGLLGAAPFTRRALPGAPWWAPSAYRAPAPRLALPVPTLRVLSSAPTPAGWRTTVQIASARAAPELVLLFPPEAAVRTVQIAQQAWPLAALPGGWRFLDFLGPPTAGVSVSFESTATAFDLVLLDQDYGLPSPGRFLERARPVTTIPWQNGDLTAVSTRVHLEPAAPPLHAAVAARPQPGTSMRSAAAPMTAVAIQPSTATGRLTVNAPMTALLDASRMMTTIRGTATTPLITALQNSARIGLIGRYWMTRPASTPTAMTP
jgi:hypothetical protein